MGWSAIILAILKVFGPMLLEWIQKWLESRLQAAAAKLPEFATYGNEGSARHALFEQAIADLPRLAYARKALLRNLRDKAIEVDVTSAGVIRPLTDDEVTEIAAQAATAAEE